MKVSKVSVGDGPVEVAVSDKKVYVANYGSDDLSIINGTDNMKIPVGDGPVAIAALPSDPDKKVYVANYGSDTVSVINGTDNSLITNIPVGDGPVAIRVLVTTTSAPPSDIHSDKTIYVANYGSDTVSVINGTDNSLITNIPVGDGPMDIEIAAPELYVRQQGF